MRFRLQAGAEFDTMTPGEAVSLARAQAAREEALRGDQFVNYSTITFTASGTVFQTKVHTVRSGYTDHLQRFTISFYGDSFTSPVTADIRLYRSGNVSPSNLITATIQVPNIYEGASGSDDAPILFGGTEVDLYCPNVPAGIANLVVGVSLQFRRCPDYIPPISLEPHNPDARAARTLPAQDVSLIPAAIAQAG